MQSQWMPQFTKSDCDDARQFARAIARMPQLAERLQWYRDSRMRSRWMPRFAKSDCNDSRRFAKAIARMLWFAKSNRDDARQFARAIAWMPRFAESDRDETAIRWERSRWYRDLQKAIAMWLRFAESDRIDTAIRKMQLRWPKIQRTASATFFGRWSIRKNLSWTTRVARHSVPWSFWSQSTSQRLRLTSRSERRRFTPNLKSQFNTQG